MRWRLRFAPMALALALGSTGLAWAQEAEVEALHQRGQAEFAAGNLNAALEIFNRLYVRTREPRALARLAAVEAALSRWENAWNHLNLALAAANTPWIRDNREVLLRNRARVEAHLATLTVQCNVVGATLLVNGQQTATLPLTEPLRVLPGTVHVEVRREGYSSFTQDVSLVLGAPVSVTAVLAPIDREPVATASNPGLPADEPPTSHADANRPPRIVVDLGGGLGMAYLSGRMSYAEQFVNASTGMPVCGNYTCYANIDPGFTPTYWLNATIRYNINHRVGIGFGVRFQFDTAEWTVQPPNGRGPTKDNPFANLLIMTRVYVATNQLGFQHVGLVPSLFLGIGYGQIEPKPGLPASARYPSAGPFS